jgi:phenylalanyl-tRNA synthetase beta chain
MKIPLSWLRDFVDLPDDVTLLHEILDDLGLVVEGVENVGAGLEDVVVARVEEIHAIEGADRIRRVIVEAGAGPIEIVCGAMNFEVGNHVPLAPVGAVLPGNFEIALRKMRGVTSNGMLCSGKELGLGDDHNGLMLLDGFEGVHPGLPLLELLRVSADVVFDISPEGNRPDAWSVMGVARDLAARFSTTIHDPAQRVSESGGTARASASITAPELCGQLLVAEIRGVVVSDSPSHVVRRLEMAGMRAINNVVDASNYVMLERGQPTHPYDVAHVAGQHIGVRQAQPGEILVTLDGVERELGRPGRGLGDTGVDCVIVDSKDCVIGLAGIMGGASSEIRADTCEVLLEVAYFDPMTIARSSKRLGLRSEASHRFERGVDFNNAHAAMNRFVEVLSWSSPDIEWVRTQHSEGILPELPVVAVSTLEISALLGTDISADEAARLLRFLNCEVTVAGETLSVRVPSSRLDIRSGEAGRADLIEEIARLYSYRRLGRRTPTWTQAGAWSARQNLRRSLRSTSVGMGWLEAWTPSLGSDEDFELTNPLGTKIRITNPLAAEESVFRSSMVIGLARAWSRNQERGNGDVVLFEIGSVAVHPNDAPVKRLARGGNAGVQEVLLPSEHEVMTVVLGRVDDDAVSAVASWRVIAGRLALADTDLVQSTGPAGWHPTRYALIVDASTRAVIGRVGEIDPALMVNVAPKARVGQRLGLLELDIDVVGDSQQVLRRSLTTPVPSKFPAVLFDLALVTPLSVSASTLARSLRAASDVVESVELFDVFSGGNLPPDVRSLAFAIRLSARDRTLDEAEVMTARAALLQAAAGLHAELRGAPLL